MCALFLIIIIALFVFAAISAYWIILLIAGAIVVIVALIASLAKRNGNTEQQNNFNNSQQQSEKINPDSRNIVGLELSGGKYVGGRDIEVGIYDLIVVSGSGTIGTDFPDSFIVNLNFDANDKYNNLEIASGTNLRIATTIIIKLYNKREYVQ